MPSYRRQRDAAAVAIGFIAAFAAAAAFCCFIEPRYRYDITCCFRHAASLPLPAHAVVTHAWSPSLLLRWR